jgi:peptidase E
VLAGLSAGAMCWFKGGITKSYGAPAPTHGLGFLSASLTVHHDGEPERRPVFLEAIRSGALPGGFAVDDGCGLLFAGKSLVEAVASRPGARAYRVDSEGERPLDVRLLAGDEAGVVPDDVAELRALRRLTRPSY